jgi:hypothetical protein
MNKKLTGTALAKFEANRDERQEVPDDVCEIKAGGGKRKRTKSKSYVVLSAPSEAMANLVRFWKTGKGSPRTRTDDL